MRFALALSAALVCLGGPVLASEPGAPAGPTLPPTPEVGPLDVAAAQAEADRLIAAAQAGAWFENITDSAVPTVRHIPSGMICLFPRNSPDSQIAIFPSSMPRGDDVGCVTYDDDLRVYTTLYASRYDPLPSEREVLQLANDAIRTRFPDARPFAGQLMQASAEGRPAPIGSAWRLTLNGQDSLSLVLVSHSREWGFKERVTGPIEESDTVSLLAAVRFVHALSAVENWPQ